MRLIQPQVAEVWKSVVLGTVVKTLLHGAVCTTDPGPASIS